MAALTPSCPAGGRCLLSVCPAFNPSARTQRQLLSLATNAPCAQRCSRTHPALAPMLEGLRTLQQRLLGQTRSRGGAGVPSFPSADAAPAPPPAARWLAWLSRGGAGREPVLPVRRPKHKGGTPTGSPPGSRRLLRGGGRPGLQRLMRAALLLLVAAAVAAGTVAAAAALYYRSIMHEPATALAAAAAEVQQAVRAAEAAAVWPAGAPGLAEKDDSQPAETDDLQPPKPAEVDTLLPQDDSTGADPPGVVPQQLLMSNYTGG